MAALLIDHNVLVLQQVEYRPGHVEPAGCVEGGEAVPVAEVCLDVPVPQQVLPHLWLVITHRSAQSPAGLHVDIDIVVQGHPHYLYVSSLAGLQKCFLQ